MDETKSALVKKIGEGNKSLSVIVAEDKLAKFKRFSQSINLSMGYLLNQAIDRYLASNSTEIFSTSTGVSTTTIGTVGDGDIEELINTTIKTYLLNNPIGIQSQTDIEELINTTIDDKISKASIGDDGVRAEVEALGELVTELETYTQSQFKAVREELKKPLAIANPTTPTDKDPNVKSWAEFFTMIGMDALKATEAQKKENIDIRAKQIEHGIQAAKEQGLGEWTVKVAGRSFVRVGD